LFWHKLKQRLKSKKTKNFFINEKDLRSAKGLKNAPGNLNYWSGNKNKASIVNSTEAKGIIYPKSSEILNQNFFNYLARNFHLNHTGIHGYDHWLRVLHNGRLISEENGSNLKVVELFSLIHDSQRVNDQNDPKHGERAAIFAESLRTKWFNITDSEMQLLQDACILHSEGMTDNNITLQTCWDADRLDFGRTGLRPDPEKLCTNFAKRPLILEEAYQRSVVRLFK
jgi:uncharacterized protein